ncbi:hypothetical protein H10PHJ05_21 [Aeromonas phage HJ05]|nr:hypothetical protein H10PHJ05_21 [Aeromonas phage HJ05]
MSAVHPAFIAQPPRSRLHRLVWGAIHVATVTSAMAAATAAVVYPTVAHVYRPTAHVDLNTGRCIKVVNHVPTDADTCSDYENTPADSRGERFNVVMDFDSGSIVK